MSTQKQQNSCEYCHQKPKFGNHEYCGKTCSQQAATKNKNNAGAHPNPQPGPTPCKQCNKKPKFQNFEFCGKNCASTWQLAHGGSHGNSNPVKNSPGGNPLGNGLNTQIPGQLLGHIPQPLQAQLQAVLPALAAAFQQQGPSPPPHQQQPPPNVNSNVGNAAPVPPSNVPQQPTVTTSARNNPNAIPPQQDTNLNLTGASGPPVQQNTQGSANGTNITATPTPALNQVQAANVPVTCRLTGCTKSVYTDATSNQASEYCSKRHREEAVATGQAKACIMCLKMPRTSTDHFCSKVCREAALNK